MILYQLFSSAFSQLCAMILPGLSTHTLFDGVFTNNDKKNHTHIGINGGGCTIPNVGPGVGPARQVYFKVFVAKIY